MKRSLNAILTLAIISPILSTPSFADDKSKTIYGEDDRIELFQASPKAAALADSVISFWKWNQYTSDAASISLKTIKLAEEYNLCPGERFGEQRGGTFCSGSLVGEDLVLTAGHCLIDQECDDTKIVFGFAIRKSGGSAPARINQKDVYECKQIVSRFFGEAPALDYALVQLDRPVVGHKPLAISRGQNLKKGDKLMAIGHPTGLPLKIAEGAIRDASPDVYFTTDLDTFKGSSGSPVFNTATGLIEGILVRGDKDFESTPAGCNTLAVYPQDGGRGEDVTKISAIESLIPKLAEENKSSSVSFQGVNAVITAPSAQHGLGKRFSADFQ